MFFFKLWIEFNIQWVFQKKCQWFYDKNALEIILQLIWIKNHFTLKIWEIILLQNAMEMDFLCMQMISL